MSMSGGMESAAQLRVQIIGDPTNLQESLDAVSAHASNVAGRMTNLFSNVGGIVGSAIAFGGAYALLSKGVDLASQQTSLQAQQAVLVKNQGSASMAFVGGLSTVLGTQTAINKAGEQYSALLDQQATKMSFQTGISKNSIIQAQNLLIPNQDLTKLYNSQNAETKKSGDYLNQSLIAAANLSAQMGSRGSVVTGAKALGRVLADPAKAMSSMSRMGFHLSKPMQEQIKLTEKRNGLLAAQQLTIKDINSQLGGTAEAAITPVERLQNDFNNLGQTLGRGLMPVIDNMAALLGAALQAAMPLFNAIAQSMTLVSSTIGNALGALVTSFMPMIKIFTSGFLPALLAVLKPIIGFFSAVGQILSKVFSSKEIGIFVNLFIKLGTAVAGAILPALNELAGIFKKLEQSGQLTQLLNAFLGVLTAILPVLPTLVTAFAQMLQAVMPIIPYFAELVTILAKISAKTINALVSGFDGFVRVITKFKPLFAVLGGIMLAFAAVWFSKKLFQTPMMALVQGTEKMVGSVLRQTIRMKAGFKGAFSGIREEGDSAFAGMGMGWRKGLAAAEKDIRQRQLNMMVLTKQVNPRSATRLQRMLDVQGPQAEEVYKNARLQTMPLFGKYFAARQKAGESDAAYEARQAELKKARGVKNYLLGSNLSVQEFMKQSQLPSEDEEGNISALNENTKALQASADMFKTGMSSTVHTGAESYKNSPYYQAMMIASAKPGGTTQEEKDAWSAKTYQKMKQMGEETARQRLATEKSAKSLDSISKPSFFSRLGGRFGGTGGGRQFASGVGMAATGAFGAATSFALGGGMGQLSQLGKGLSDLFNGKKVDWSGMMTGALQLSGELGSMAPLVHGLGNMFGGLGAIVKKMFGSEVLEAVAAGTGTETAIGTSMTTISGEAAAMSASVEGNFATITGVAGSTGTESATLFGASMTTISEEAAAMSAVVEGNFTTIGAVANATSAQMVTDFTGATRTVDAEMTATEGASVGVFGKISTTVKTFAANAVSWIKDFSLTAGIWMSNLASAVSDAFLLMAGKAKKFALTALSWMKNFALAAGTWMKNLASSAGTALASMAGKVKAFALTAGAWVRNFALTAGTWMKGFALSAGAWIRNLATTVSDAFVLMAGKAKAFALSALGAIKKFAVAASTMITETIIPAIGEMAGAFKGFVLSALAGMKELALGAWAAITETIIPAIVEMGAALWTALLPILPELLLITGAVALVGTAVYLIIKYWKDVKHWAVDAWHGIEDAARVVFGWIQGAWGGIMDAGKVVMGWFVSAWNTVLSSAKGAWNGIKSAAKTVFSWIEGAWGAVMGAGKKVMSWFVGAWGDVRGVAVGVWHDILGAGKKVWSWLTGAFGYVENVSKNMWDGMYNGFVTAANMIIKAYNTTLGNVFGWLGMGGGAKFGYLKPIGAPSASGGKTAPTTAGAMNVHILSASAAAGKALTGTKGSNVPHTTVNVHQGAFQVNVQGSLDSASMSDVKNHVNEQFKQLKYAVRAQGR